MSAAINCPYSNKEKKKDEEEKITASPVIRVPTARKKKFISQPRTLHLQTYLFGSGRARSAFETGLEVCEGSTDTLG